MSDEAKATPETPSESQILLHDVLLIHRVYGQLAKERPIDAKPHEGRFYRIAGDLWQQHVNHCQAVGILLQVGLFDSAMVVNRAAYEAAITLTYLRTVGDRIRNAALFEAHMLVDTASIYADEPGDTAAIAQKAIATVPADIIAEVRANRKAGRPWSGKTLAEMAAAIDVTGHRTAYAIMSWSAHARFAGQRIERTQHPDGTVQWQFLPTATPQDFESLANHTRRMMHQMYFALTRDFYGMTVPLPTSDPSAAEAQTNQGPDVR